MMEFIQDNMAYPKTTLEEGIEGVVYVQYIVKTDGSISNIKILKRIHPDLEAEAIRIVQIIPKWIPAIRCGKGAPVYINLPVVFKLTK